MHCSSTMNLQGGKQLNKDHHLIMAQWYTEPCNVFLIHKSTDTKKRKETVATLLYDHLRRFNLHLFLDNKTMKPGGKLALVGGKGRTSCGRANNGRRRWQVPSNSGNSSFLSSSFSGCGWFCMHLCMHALMELWLMSQFPFFMKLTAGEAATSS